MKNPKLARNYARTRGYLEKLDEMGPKTVLNSLYNVYPIEFEPPEVQRRIREIFAPYKQEVGMFTINLARLYRRNPGVKVAICCMPKSGSTFVLTSLSRLPEKHRFEGVYLQSPYFNPDFVGGLAREHEIDELSLLLLEMRTGNWTSHMHTKWTPYTEQMFRAHDIRPIVTYRNIFDCIVSMDDMIMKNEVTGFSMLRLPRRYQEMDEADRLTMLCQFAGPWYIDYVVSWSRVEMDVLKLHYDDDIRGFSDATAAKIRNFLGLQAIPEDAFRQAFSLETEEAKKSARLNKGQSGRGEKIPAAAREAVLRMTDAFKDEVDFSRVL